MTRRPGSAAFTTGMPEDAESHARRAFGLLAANKPREALAAADEALALNPHSFKALKGRSLALLALGRTRQTLQAAEDAVRASPTDPAGHFVKALLWTQRRSWSKADLEFRRAIELAPNHLGILTSYARTLLQRGDLAQAEEILQRCAAIRQDDPQTILLRGEIALRSGRRDEAKECARWALSLNAKNAAAISLVARSEARAFLTGGRLILPAIILLFCLPLANSFLHIGTNAVTVACGILSAAVWLFLMSWRAHVRTRVRREMRDVQLKKDF